MIRSNSVGIVRFRSTLGAAFALAVLLTCASCSSDSGGGSDDSSSFSAPDCSGSTTLVDGTFTSGVPQWIQDNFKCINASVSGDNVVIKTKTLPPYMSAYYSSSATLYDSPPNMPTTATYQHSTNPNSISAQEMTFTIPATPITTFASLSPTFTENTADMGGVAIDGVAIFNAFAASPDVLADEAWTMDNNNGHSTNTGAYHYHVEPWQLTDVTGNRLGHGGAYNPAALIGIALDGLPIYGAHDQDGHNGCSGSTCLPTLSDSDTNIDGDVAANFHCHTTNEFPSGVCHYHVLTGYTQNTTDPIGDVPDNTSTELRYMVKYIAGDKGSVSFGTSSASLMRRFRMASMLATAGLCGPNGLPLVGR